MNIIGAFTFITQNFIPLLVGIWGVGFVIAFHELGHFLFAKLYGVKIPSFSIGFGPKLLSTKIGSTTFSISAIPVGGYVEAEVGDYSDPTPGTIAAIAYWKKIMIIVGGIMFNVIFAYVTFVGLSMTGIPGNPFLVGSGKHLIQKVVKDSPAEKAGLKAGEQIIVIDGIDTKKDVSKLLDVLKNKAGQAVQLTVEQDNKVKNLEVTVGSKTIKGKQVGSLGVYFGFASTPPVPFTTALKRGFTITWSILQNTVKGFGRAFSKRSTDGLAGPLQMISLSIETAKNSAGLFFLFLAFVSISLAVLNLIPLPILDGGQAVTYTIEAIIGRSIKERTLEYVHYTCWIAMLTLFLYLTFKDVVAIWF